LTTGLSSWIESIFAGVLSEIANPNRLGFGLLADAPDDQLWLDRNHFGNIGDSDDNHGS